MTSKIHGYKNGAGLGVWALLSAAGAAASAYHGYKRNVASNPVAWAIWWGLWGSALPVITVPIAFAQGFAKVGMSYATTSVGSTAPPVVREWYKLKQTYRYQVGAEDIGWLWADKASALEILRASSQTEHWVGKHDSGASSTAPWWVARSLNCKINSDWGGYDLMQTGWMAIYKNKVFRGWFYGNCTVMRHVIAWMNNHSHSEYKLAVCHYPSVQDPLEYCLTV